MENSNNYARETGGKLATIAYFTSPEEAKSLYEKGITCDRSTKQGIVRTLAFNVANPELKLKCLNELEKFYNDRDGNVRKDLVTVFAYLPEPDPEIENFINNFLKSQSLPERPGYLMDYIKKHNTNHNLTLHISEQIIEACNKGTINIDKIEDQMANITKDVYSNSIDDKLKEKAFDIFEMILKIVSRAAKNALNADDRESIQI
jgi:hypothetical protein